MIWSRNAPVPVYEVFRFDIKMRYAVTMQECDPLDSLLGKVNQLPEMVASI